MNQDDRSSDVNQREKNGEPGWSVEGFSNSAKKENVNQGG